MDITKLKKIDVGATADLYDLGNGRLFKCFHHDKPDISIDNEYECTKKIQDFHLGAPIVFERITDKNERGFVMEYIHGENMLMKILKLGTDFEELITLWANLHFKVNSIHTTSFNSAHKILSWRIQNSHSLSDTQKSNVLYLLQSLPQDDCLCHTDLHPGNILLTTKGAHIIDWCDVMVGSKWCDVARTMLLFEQIDIPHNFDRKSVEVFFHQGREIFLNEYTKLAGSSKEELSGWMAVLAAARMNNESEGNRIAYQKIIENALLSNK